MQTIVIASSNDIAVFNVIGSPNKKYAIVVNTIIPTPNPINRLGHISPSPANTKYLVDCIYSQAKGIPANKTSQV
jgi:hypothetical protein